MSEQPEVSGLLTILSPLTTDDHYWPPITTDHWQTYSSIIKQTQQPISQRSKFPTVIKCTVTWFPSTMSLWSLSHVVAAKWAFSSSNQPNDVSTEGSCFFMMFFVDKDKCQHCHIVNVFTPELHFGISLLKHFSGDKKCADHWPENSSSDRQPAGTATYLNAPFYWKPLYYLFTARTGDACDFL